MYLSTVQFLQDLIGQQLESIGQVCLIAVGLWDLASPRHWPVPHNLRLESP